MFAPVIRTFISVVLITATPMRSMAGEERAIDLTMAISLMLRDPAISGHGVALENYEDERYDHSITVQFTGPEGDAVEKQIFKTAEVALRVGHISIDKDLPPPGKHLIVKMAILRKDGGFTNTFSVRYEWADVLTTAKANGGIAGLVAKGKIEEIWLEYWPTMCLNPAPHELFVNGGEPLMPEDVENPKDKDLSCHRVR